MKTLDFIKEIKIDLTKGYIEPDQWTAGNHQFDISPKDFLLFSKQDYNLNDSRGFINALTNAKRAIDCQTDKIFYSLGIDPNNFPNEVVESFIAKTDNPPQKDLPIRLRLLQAIGYAPISIIANVRTLRHSLEHFYEKPTKVEVSNAIELSELFLQATDSKLRSLSDFSMTDIEKHNENPLNLYSSIYVTFNYKKSWFKIEGWKNKDKIGEIHIKNISEEFYYLLKITSSFDYKIDLVDALKEWFKFINHPLPIKHVDFECVI